jgi:hypothetical protein
MSHSARDGKIVVSAVFACVLHLCCFHRAEAQRSTDAAVTVSSELRQLYRFDTLPRYRQKSLIGMTSSFDRTGGNDDGFSGKYSFIRKEGAKRLVLAELQGPGLVHRIWTPTPTPDMIAFYFDGEPTPRLRLPFSELFSGKTFPFVRPVVGNEVGGYYSYVPLPYARSLKIVLEGEKIEFQQIS